jgi:hypothetical protein
MVEQHLAHIAGLEQQFGPDSEPVAVALNTLAGLICKYQQSEDAVPYFERCLQIRAQLRGPRAVLAEIDRWLDQPLCFAAREPFLLKRIEIRAEVLGECDASLADECASLAGVYANLNRTAEARILFERSLAIRQAAGDTGSAELVTLLERLVEISLREKQRAQAAGYLAQCREVVEASNGTASAQTAQTLVTLAATLIAAVQFERSHRNPAGLREARPLFEQAFAILESRFGPDSHELQKALERIARACLDARQFWAAEPLLNRLLAIGERVYGAEAAALLWILTELADGYADDGAAAAGAVLDRAYAVLRRFLDARRPMVRDDITELPGAADVLFSGRGGLLERLTGASETHRRNLRRRWGASR